MPYDVEIEDLAERIGTEVKAVRAEVSAPLRYDASKLRAFNLAMSKRESTPVDILIVGASWEAGTGVAAPPAQRWVDQFQWRLRNAHNPGNVPGGVGYRESYSFTAGWNTPFTYSGTAGVDYAAASTSGVGRKNVVIQTINTTVTFTSPGSGVTVYYATGPSRGTWTWKVGAGSETVVNSDAVSTGDDSVTFSTPPGSVVTLKNTEASGLSFQGVYFHNLDETKGIRVFGGGVSGYRSTDFIDVGETAYGYVSEIQPDLIIFGSMWGNDYIGGVADAPISAAQSRTNTETLIAEYRSRCTVPPSIAFVIIPQVHDADTSPATVDTWATFRAMLLDLAHDDGNIALIDTTELFGLSLVGTDTYGITSGDQVHLNAAGMDAVASFAARTLTGDRGSAPRVVTAPDGSDHTGLPTGTFFAEYTP